MKKLIAWTKGFVSGIHLMLTVIMALACLGWYAENEEKKKEKRQYVRYSNYTHK